MYGYDNHYTHVCCWGAQDEEKHYGNLGTLLRKSTDGVVDLPVYLSQVLQVEVTSTLPKKAPIPDFVITDDFAKRTSDVELWPRPNTRAIASTKNCAEMVTTGTVASALATDGIIPVIVSPNPKERNQSVKVPFGPMLTTMHQPCKPGGLYKSSTIYNQYQLKKRVEFNDAWSSNVLFANAVILRLPEKNGLPYDVPIEEGMSPLGEIKRIMKDSSSRIGFDLFGSGGNAAIAGATPPDANSKKTVSKTAAAGAVFESSQTILNKLNAIMELICERGTPIVVFVTGEALPKKYYDFELQQIIGLDEEQAMYMGVYNIRRRAQDMPMSPSMIQMIVDHYKLDYPNLDILNLRFLLETPKRYRLFPNNDYSTRRGGFHHLEVDTRDDRRPIFELPPRATFPKLLRAMPEAGEGGVAFMSEKQMFLSWVEGRGYLQFIQEPYANDHVESGHLVGDLFVPRPLDDNEAGTMLANKMAHRSRRKQTFKDHFSNLIRASVASFARTAEINIDADHKIGPLIDSCALSHRGPSVLSNYDKHFGNDRKFKFMSFLGREFTSSPLSHPVSTYDPNVLLLMRCNGGGTERLNRIGIGWIKNDGHRAANIFFHCILVEIVRVRVLLDWSFCFHDDDNHLPDLSEVPVFLQFIDEYLQRTKATTTTSIIQDQYEINENFKDRGMFRQFFMYIHQELEPWMSRLVISMDVQSAADSTVDLFTEANKMLTTFINADNAIGDQSSKQPFHSQHILLNLNEVVADFPFGIPICPVIGFGGGFGAQLLQEEGFNSSDSKMGQQGVMTKLLELYSTEASNSELAMLGLKRLQDGSVVVAINNLPITVCLPEHGCCEQYYVVERGPGGTKGLGDCPKLTFTYCHPIPRTNFMSEEAALALSTFRLLVESGKWDKDSDETDDEQDWSADQDDTREEEVEREQTSNEGMSSNESSKEEDSDSEEALEIIVDDDERSNAAVESDVGFVKKKRLDEEEKNNMSSPPPSKRTRSSMVDVNTITQPTPFSYMRHTLVAPNNEINLMLGMIYGDMQGTAEMIALGNDYSNYSSQLRRDTARCVATETLCKRPVFTIDNRPGDSNRKDRHICMDMMSIDLDQHLLAPYLGKVHQICLDHFWFLPSYWDEKGASTTFFSDTVPKLQHLLKGKGTIYLGICAQIFAGLAKHKDEIELQFSVSLVLRSAVTEIDLIRGSHMIPDHLYHSHVLGNKEAKPELRFKISYQMVKETIGSFLNVDPLMVNTYLRQLVGTCHIPDDYAFIRLTKLVND
jgi:hypothetical protein